MGKYYIVEKIEYKDHKELNIYYFLQYKFWGILTIFADERNKDVFISNSIYPGQQIFITEKSVFFRAKNGKYTIYEFERVGERYLKWKSLKHETCQQCKEFKKELTVTIEEHIQLEKDIEILKQMYEISIKMIDMQQKQIHYLKLKRDFRL